MPRTAKPTVSTRVKDSARLTAWVVGLASAVSGLGALLAQHRGGSLAVQAFAAEWGAGRLGVTWSDPEGPPLTFRQVARRVVVGLGLGAAVAALALGSAAMTGAVTFSRWGFSLPSVLVGLFGACLIAMRDELLLRGLVLRAFRHTLSPVGRLAVAVLVGGAFRGSETNDGAGWAASLLTFASAACLSLGFASLWLRERGAWTAWGAHVAWLLTTTTLVSGGVCNAEWRSSWWGTRIASIDTSPPVLVALALPAALAFATWYRATARKG